MTVFCPPIAATGVISSFMTMLEVSCSELRPMTADYSGFVIDVSPSLPTLPSFCSSFVCLSYWVLTGVVACWCSPLRLPFTLWNDPERFLRFSAASSFYYYIYYLSFFFCCELTKEAPWEPVEGGKLTFGPARWVIIFWVLLRRLAGLKKKERIWLCLPIYVERRNSSCRLFWPVDCWELELVSGILGVLL